MHLDVARRRQNEETVFLLGPGGVGKSTLGRELARKLGWPLIDLDLEFCDRIGIIGPYIAEHGYGLYRDKNLKLAEALVADIAGPALFVAASGFLAAPKGSEDHRRAQALVQSGYRVVLIPSLDVESAASVVVARQMQRGFGLEQARENEKFRARFPIYLESWDMLVVSVDPPEHLARALIASGLGS